MLENVPRAGGVWEENAERRRPAGTTMNHVTSHFENDGRWLMGSATRGKPYGSSQRPSSDEQKREEWHVAR